MHPRSSLAVVFFVLVLSTFIDQAVVRVVGGRWQSPECPYGRNFWIGCDLCKCNPDGLRLCAGLRCPGTGECPKIPAGAAWLRGACGERCACGEASRIIHCERYCSTTDAYYFYPHAHLG